MKFDIDCAREILLTLEAKENDCSMSFTELNNSLPSFSSNPLVVEYNCFRLEELGCISLKRKSVGNRYIDVIESVNGITATGHMYLSELTDISQQAETNPERNTKAPNHKSCNEIFKIIKKIAKFIAALAAFILTCIEIYKHCFS